MAGTKYLVLFAALLLVLSGCSAFFDFNAFSLLDKPAAPSPSRYQGSSGLSNLQADLQSQAIVNALRGDQTTSQQILANLEGSYSVHSGALGSPDLKTAAVLYAGLALASTYGDELANNVVTNIVSTPQTGNISSLIISIIPPEVAGDSTKFSGMVLGLLDANTVYLNLGSNLPPAPPGVNMGDVAQKAAVAFMMDAIVSAVETQATLTQPQAVAQMFKLVNNDPSNTIAGVSLATNPLSPLDVRLKNIFDAAGAPYPA